jgi:hypothetical protein
MQIGAVNGFAKRVLYNTSRSYSDQINRVDFYKQLRPVIIIGILNFVHTSNKNYISRNQVRDIETGERTMITLRSNFQF